MSNEHPPAIGRASAISALGLLLSFAALVGMLLLYLSWMVDGTA